MMTSANGTPTQMAPPIIDASRVRHILKTDCCPKVTPFPGKSCKFEVAVRIAITSTWRSR